MHTSADLWSIFALSVTLKVIGVFPDGLLPFGFLWLASMILWYPFLPTILLNVFLMGGITGMVKWSYNLDEINLGSKLQFEYNEESPLNITGPS